MNQKSKEGLGNIITVVGAILILMGIFYSVSVGIDNGWQVSFFTCLIGTILTFVGQYLKNGYIKFFN